MLLLAFTTLGFLKRVCEPFWAKRRISKKHLFSHVYYVCFYRLQEAESALGKKDHQIASLSSRIADTNEDLRVLAGQLAACRHRELALTEAEAVLESSEARLKEENASLNRRLREEQEQWQRYALKEDRVLFGGGGER